MSKPKCFFPNKALAIKGTRFVSHCAQSDVMFNRYDGTEKSLSKTEFNEKRKELHEAMMRGEQPKECFKCWEQENRGLKSRRQLYYDQFAQNESYEIEHLDIFTGNACNLACRMCNPAKSTSWIKDQSLASNLSFDLPEFENTKVLNSLTEGVFEYVAGLKNLKRITLKGGEIFMNKGLGAFLRVIPNPQDVELTFNTNGTIVDTAALDIMKSFKKINCMVSAEAEGAMYGYIRGGKKFSLEDVFVNIKNIEAHLGSVVNIEWLITGNIYGVFSYDRLVDKIDGWFPNSKQSGYYQIVYQPLFLNPLVIPKHIREQIISESDQEDFKQFLSYDIEERYASQIGEDTAESLLAKFKEYTQVLDRMRKQNLFEVEPRFREVFAELQIKKMA